MIVSIELGTWHCWVSWQVPPPGRGAVAGRRALRARLRTKEWYVIETLSYYMCCWHPRGVDACPPVGSLLGGCRRPPTFSGDAHERGGGARAGTV